MRIPCLVFSASVWNMEDFLILFCSVLSCPVLSYMFGRRFFASSRIGIFAFVITVVPFTYISSALVWKPQRGGEQGGRRQRHPALLFSFSTENIREGGFLFFQVGEEGRKGGRRYIQTAGRIRLIFFTLRYWSRGYIRTGCIIDGKKEGRGKKDLEIP